VGHIKIVDRDYIELSNLQRQTLFDEDDIAQGLPKAVAAVEKLRRINSDIQLEPLVTDLNPFNVERILGDVDLVLDGTDNFEARFLVNDACLKLGLPWVYGAVIATYGVTMSIVPQHTSCLRCLLRDQPPPGTLPTCDTAGVLGTAPFVIGALEVSQAFKLLLDGGQEFWGHLTQVDVWSSEWLQIHVERDPECPACGLGHYEFLEAKEGSFVTSLCGREAVQVNVRGDVRLSLPQLAERLATRGPVQFNEYMLRCEVEGYEIAVFPNGRAIIKGTTDENEARTVYAKYIGL
jgi:molybdopterin/thiamine biosynthesis adenylyltransferase